MSVHIRHELLAPEAIEARAYQLSAVDHCLSGSTLLVLPTGMGKTPIEAMVLAERLRETGGRAIMIAPTNALVSQHVEDLRTFLALEATEIVGLTGNMPPKRRDAVWAAARVVVATPQVVRNDVQNGRTSLADLAVLVVDEAHRATGNHAMAQVGDLFAEQQPGGLVLAATASPGHIEADIHAVCDRLRLVNIHARPPGDALLAPYATGLDVNDVLVEVPTELRTLAKPLETWLARIVDRQRRLGYYTRQGHITTGGLQEARQRISTAIGRGESIAYRAAKDNAIAMRLNHLVACLLCQGVAATRETLSRVEEGEAANVREFLADSRIQQLRTTLAEMEECHSKVTMVRRMVRRQLKLSPESRIIVFANLRDTVEEITRILADVEMARPQRFVGQTSRDGSTGMSQKDQIERLDAFRAGEANVLVATSVGEEGLDVPNADLVIFYEPVGSEIRTIQRRGRTGRQRAGTVHVLIAQATRDEGARAAARHREERMHRSIQQVRRKRGGAPVRAEGAFLRLFSVGETPAADHLRSESARLAPDLDDTVPPEVVREVEPEPAAPVDPQSIADRLRPRGQVGLDAFPEETDPGRLIDPEALGTENLLAAEALVQSLQAEMPALEAQDGVVVTVDHREGQSALAARLRQNGLTVEVDTLPVGDVRIGDRILIERKRARDFVDSLLDGRLLDQATRLVGASPRALLILEGRDLFQHRAVHGQAIMGALATLTLDYGLPVVSANDTAETARFIAVSARRESKMIEHLSADARQRMRAADHPDRFDEAAERVAVGAADASITGAAFQAPILDATTHPLSEARRREMHGITRAMLEQVPGIGPALASRILARWPSLASLARAREEEILEVPGLSLALTRSILDLLHGEA